MPVLSKLPAILVAALAAALLAPGAAAAAAPDVARAALACPNADLAPAPDNLALVEDAAACLHNGVRAQRRLPGLRDNARLRRAALGHAQDMVTTGFFGHTTPAGRTMVDRILRTRYVRRNRGWALGENLAWGTGALATPRGAMQAWIDSPGHRANILKRGYRDVGVGVILGVPVSDAPGATYTVEFGVRR